MISRAYITQNYVAKVKKSKAGNEIQVVKDHTAVADAIPFPATAVREMGEEAESHRTVQRSAHQPKPDESVHPPKDNFEMKPSGRSWRGAESMRAGTN